MSFPVPRQQFQVEFRQAPRSVNWIVSYPRSGNTFLRAVISNYFSGLDRPLTLLEIAAATCGEHEERLWLELTGLTPSERSFEQEWNKREAYLLRLRTMTSAAMPIVKSHTLHIQDISQPAFQFLAGDRIVHIVRHPCDVVVSNANISGMNIADAIRFHLTRGLFIHSPPAFGYEFIGSWAQHTRSWMGALDAPLLRIRYCDLLDQTAEELMRVVTFLGFEPDRRRAELAASFSDFHELRSQELENGFAENTSKAEGLFFNEGKPGQWLGKLTVEQALQIQNDDPELLDMLGFGRVAADHIVGPPA